jgi:hypothetical protein
VPSQIPDEHERRISKDLKVLAVANLLAGVDVNPNRRWSLLSFLPPSDAPRATGETCGSLVFLVGPRATIFSALSGNGRRITGIALGMDWLDDRVRRRCEEAVGKM